MSDDEDEFVTDEELKQAFQTLQKKTEAATIEWLDAGGKSISALLEAGVSLTAVKGMVQGGQEAAWDAVELRRVVDEWEQFMTKAFDLIYVKDEIEGNELRTLVHDAVKKMSDDVRQSLTDLALNLSDLNGGQHE